MRTVAIANAKGGTGKSSVATHLAVGASRLGLRTLLVDLDVQGNATSWLMPEGKLKGAADVLMSGTLAPDCLHQVPGEGRERLKLVPGTPELARVDIALANEVGGETFLREALQGAKSQFDLVLLDCPPNMGLTVLNALVASNEVLVPVAPSFFSLSGLKRLDDTITRIGQRLNAQTRVCGYVLFAVDNRESIADETRELLRKQMNKGLFRSEIRVNTLAKAAPARQLTAWEDSDPRGQEDYRALLKEFLERIGVEVVTARRKRA